MQKKPLILIIDDLKSNRMVVKKILQNNYSFIEAKNGIEALELLKIYTPTIILIDAIMPDMDGFKTIKKIRSIQKFKRTPVLMITSLSDTKTKIKALESGVNDFLTKPVDKYELRARCKSYLETVLLNKKYLNCKINPISKFKNETALVETLKPNDRIFLISINDFHKLDGIYGYKNTHIIEKKFGKFLKELAKDYLKDISIYHVESGKFVIKVEEKSNFDENMIQVYCDEFYTNSKNFVIKLDEYVTFSPKITIVFIKDKINLYEDAHSVLSYARTNNLKYIYDQMDINSIKDMVYSNIKIYKEVKDAINSDNIINYYQPIYDNLKEKVNKYETLVRLKCPDGKILSPLSFLEISKVGSIYHEITKIVYNNAFEKFKLTTDDFSINISYSDIEEKSVRNHIYKLLENNPHVADRVIFEILEDEQVKDFGLFKEFIKEIKHHDAKVALDDFGGGFSNLQRIVDIEPNYIKIDGSIIRKILNDEKSYNLLEHINTFAHSFGIKTVAEFIDSKELFNEINHIGIDFSQGYYFGEPKPTLLYEYECSKTF